MRVAPYLPCCGFSVMVKKVTIQDKVSAEETVMREIAGHD
jgi:hypothetical protein